MESQPVNSNKDTSCERCGRFDAIEIGDKFLCEECITQAGCACAEREMEEND